jgi:hypothetical protein
MDYNPNQNDYQYYSQDDYTPEQPEKLNPFSVASLICGIASITLCCTGVLSLPLGALGVLFAILAKRMGKSMSPLSITGIVLSCTGMVFGLIMCIYVVYLVLTDADYRRAFEDSYDQYYNEDFDEDYDDYFDQYFDQYDDGNEDDVLPFTVSPL